MQKIEITARDLQDWMGNTWQLYASQIVDRKVLRLWVNHLIVYRVNYGDSVLYEGSQMTHAIAAWESA